jgi:NAD(P)-dependent dehydrogenase (short-subunit alcohol dehydrogenase family)
MARYAIVTGANAPSIGLRAAQMLAGDPHRFRVILACRSEERGRAAQRGIESADPGAWVRFQKLDLASLASVRAFAQAVRAMDDGSVQKSGLSLLVANAGVGFGMQKERRETEDGFEMRFGVNHLGHFLLVNLLLPELRAAPRARVVVVSSGLHAGGMGSGPCSLDFDDLQLTKPGAYQVTKAYCQSKLANLMFTRELHRRLVASGCSKVTACALTPGYIPQTGLGREGGLLGRFFTQWMLDGLLKWVGLVTFTRSIEQGATCIVLAATAGVEGGGYYELSPDGNDIVPAADSDESRDPAKAERLWQLSHGMVGLKED